MLTIAKPSTWQILPEKKDDERYDDWHIGYAHQLSEKYPAYLDIHGYFAGWLYGAGLTAGKANILPASSDQSYLDGYEQGQHQRSDRHLVPDIRYIENV